MSRTFLDPVPTVEGFTNEPTSMEEAAKKLGTELRSEFERAEKMRKSVENDWLRAARQYAGQYDADVLSRIPKDERGHYLKSVVFVRHTKAKCDTLRARLVDLLFPSNGDKNWSVSPSPKPEIPQIALIQALEEAEAKGEQLPADDEKLTKQVAEDRARAMETLIDDQLTDANVNYRKVCTSVIRSGIVYGTGVLKGPLITNKEKNHYVQNDNGEWGMQYDNEEEFRPYFEFVPVWSLYPDPAATRPEQLSFVWQTHVKTRKDMIGLCRVPGFRGDIIRKYLVDNPDGDCKQKDYESQLRVISRDEDSLTSEDLKNRFRILERWGHLTGKQLEHAGLMADEILMQFPDYDPENIYASNIWITESGEVIKCAISPVEDMSIPYYFFQPYTDDTGFWTEGLPDVIRDMQVVINAAARMTLDNAAIACGPQLAVNVRALAPEEDPTTMYGGKVWLFDTPGDMGQCFQEIGVSSHISELLTIGEKYAVFSDEVSIPRYMSGDNHGVRGAGDTASGLSMLMASASMPIKDMVAAFDAGITEPFIKAMYRWNMRYSTDDRVKGDYSVKATGSSSLIAQELMGKRLLESMAALTVPGMAEQTNFEKLYSHILRASELPDDIQLTAEEIKQKQIDQARQQAVAQLEAVLAAAEQKGIPLPQQLVALVQGILQQLSAGNPGQGAQEGAPNAH